MSKPRPMTIEEMREAFLDQLETYVNYWTTIPNPMGVSGETEAQARVRGLAFSFLVMLDGGTLDLSAFNLVPVMLDGGTLDLPAFNLVPDPHPDDEEFHREEGENWWVPQVINDCQLHDEWCARGRRKK